MSDYSIPSFGPDMGTPPPREDAAVGPRCRACPSGHRGPKHDAERAFDALSPEQQEHLRGAGASTREGEAAIEADERGSSLSPDESTDGAGVTPAPPLAFALTIGCDWCGADPGEPCDGVLAPHATRRKAATTGRTDAG